MSKFCKVKDCPRLIYAKSMCKRHYAQVKNKGYTFGNPKRSSRDPLEYSQNGKVVKIKLFNRVGKLVDYAFIDKDDLSMVQKHNWHKSSKGYVEARIKNKLIKLHQFIMKKKYIDHKNRNPLDNRKINLRKANQSQQTINQERYNKLGFRGLSLRKNGHYSVRIVKNGVCKSLGTYHDIMEAAERYNKAALKYHGEFAVLNNLN